MDEEKVITKNCKLCSNPFPARLSINTDSYIYCLRCQLMSEKEPALLNFIVDVATNIARRIAENEVQNMIDKHERDNKHVDSGYWD